jgi:hypothetical protein
MNPIQDPTLEELLADPVIRLVMQSDGFTGSQVRRIAHDARQRMALPEFQGHSPKRPDLPRTPWRGATGHEVDVCCR